MRMHHPHTKISIREKTGRRRVQTINTEPTRTQEQFQNEADVNEIMKKYHKTKTITHLNTRTGAYADLTNAQGYFESAIKIQKANEAFMQLPSGVRTKFNNDPSQLLEFIQDPKNYDEGVKLGIFDPKIPTNTPPTNDEPNDEQPIKSKQPKTKNPNPPPEE